jgi:hypothetical protein
MKKLLSLIAVLPAIHGIATASDYPPGYVISTRCQSSGPVEVCALNRDYGGFPRLSVRYKGQLLESSWGRISAFVKLNGKSGMFKMSNYNYAESLLIGSFEYGRCIVRDSDHPEAQPPRGEYGWCKGDGIPGGGSLAWEVTRDVAPADQDLLFYARSDRGFANAWDIELSFVDESGNWDSRDGQNFLFRFE